MASHGLRLIHEVLELILLVLELEVLLLEGVLLGRVRGLGSCQQVGRSLTTVRVAFDVVVVELLLSCAFVEVRFISQFRRRFRALDEIILQSLWVKGLIKNVGHIHRSAELLLLQLILIVGRLRNLSGVVLRRFVDEILKSTASVSELLMVVRGSLLLLCSFVVEVDLSAVE